MRAAVFVNTAPPLTPEQLEAGLCPQSHAVSAPAETVRRAWARQTLHYCRRCVSEMLCGKGLHDLTNPDNVAGSGRCAPCRHTRKTEYWATTGSERQKANRAERKQNRQVYTSSHYDRRSYHRSGWPPRVVLDDAACRVTDATLFDAFDRENEAQSHFRTRVRACAVICDECPVKAACDAWAAERYDRTGEMRIAGGRYHGTLPGETIKSRPAPELPKPAPPKPFPARLTLADRKYGQCPHGHDITRHGTGAVKVGRSTWCRACRPDLVRLMTTGPDVPSVRSIGA